MIVKSEIRNPKHKTISKSKCTNDRNIFVRNNPSAQKETRPKSLGRVQPLSLPPGQYIHT